MPSTLTKVHPWPTLAELRSHPTVSLQPFSSTRSTKIRSMRVIKALARYEGKRIIVSNAEASEVHRGIQLKRDMYGIIDAIATESNHEPGLVMDSYESYLRSFQGTNIRAIQACATDWQPHIEKLKENIETCALWLSAPNTTLELWGWRKVKRGNRRVIRPRLQLITLDFLLEKEPAIVCEVFLD